MLGKFPWEHKSPGGTIEEPPEAPPGGGIPEGGAADPPTTTDPGEGSGGNSYPRHRPPE